MLLIEVREPTLRESKRFFSDRAITEMLYLIGNHMFSRGYCEPAECRSTTVCQLSQSQKRVPIRSVDASIRSFNARQSGRFVKPQERLQCGYLPQAFDELHSHVSSRCLP